jgi:hypothetical protein
MRFPFAASQAISKSPSWNYPYGGPLEPDSYDEPLNRIISAFQEERKRSRDETGGSLAARSYFQSECLDTHRDAHAAADA